MSSMRKRSARVKAFTNTSSTVSTSSVTTASIDVIPRSPKSPLSATSQSESPTPTRSTQHSSPDTGSPLSPALPVGSLASTAARPVDTTEHKIREDDAIDVDTDALLASSLSALSSSAHRHLPRSSPLHDVAPFAEAITRELSSAWDRLWALPLNARLSLLFLSLFYFLLFSWRTHLLLATLYAALAFAALSVRSLVLQRGLLSFVPEPALPYLSEYSLLELGHLAWSSQLTGDLLALTCFELSDGEARVIMQRLPPEWRRALVRKGVIGLLPASVASLLFPRRDAALDVAEEEKGQLEEDDVSGGPSMRAPHQEALTILSHALEHKYDAEGNPDHRLGDHAVPAAYSFLSVGSHSPRGPASSSPSANSAEAPASPSQSDDEPVDPSSVTLSALIDRQLSSSFSSVFRSWARQSYTALYDAFVDVLPSTLTSASSVHFFLPLVTVITAMHLGSSSPSARALVRRSQPVLMDAAVWLAAVAASHHVYHHLIESFNRRREERREGTGHVQGAQLARVYALFVYHRARQEKSLYVSTIVLLGWAIYLARGRGRLRGWWERRELLRLGDASQLANRIVM